MTHEDIIAKLNVIFRDVFDDPRLNLTPAMSAADVARWDSLSHIDMIVCVEEAFHIRLSTREVATMKNVGDLIGAIEAKVK